MKGIILAAGKGTRLYPITLPVCKPLLPVYDKPMIYYPLSVLMSAGIRDILVIVPGDEQQPFVELLGDGSRLGISISYAEQSVQRGIADAFLIGEEFIGDDSVCLALGDNIFYGLSLRGKLRRAVKTLEGATIFGYYVADPRPFGVVEFDRDGKAVSIEEKPKNPKSNYIVPGLYFYDNRVVEYAKNLKPSARGELEITTLNEMYLNDGLLDVSILGRGFAWLDTGTMESLAEATDFVRVMQKRQGIEISAPEEIAFRKGWLTQEQLLEAAQLYGKSPYGEHLKRVAEGKLLGWRRT